MKLASAEKILNLTPIEGADLIETADILGWKVVVKKGDYKIGDLVSYVQIDTVVPSLREYDFLESRKFRVRTIKLRNQISQGLIVPLPAGNYKEGDDLTDILQIKKYEKPDNNPRELQEKKPNSGYKKWMYLFKYNVLYKIFPSLKHKLRSTFPKELVSITDEERIQNIPHVLEKYKYKPFIASYKLDGSSITIIHSRFLFKSRFRICSRRFELHDKHNDWYKAFKSTNFEKEIKKLVKYFKTDDIIIQGELIGKKFNGNHHNLEQDEIRIFNIFVNKEKIDQLLLIDICTELDIPHCPIYKFVTLNMSMGEILKFSEIKDILNPNVEAEGLVWRCIDDNLSFKVINNKYLITEK